ncbi:hypothetical protein NDU88_002375 [Pleurodeles waltl]|uniref:Uncharacterized protein n=1 Tax=Pleurodeles waltl TaxID=8319 RepID=A0AAV7T1R8_PLEWA|nr:hypothetical protein NDU88_002375 [Pleurodeles waltl]
MCRKSWSLSLSELQLCPRQSNHTTLPTEPSAQDHSADIGCRSQPQELKGFKRLLPFLQESDTGNRSWETSELVEREGAETTNEDAASWRNETLPGSGPAETLENDRLPREAEWKSCHASEEAWPLQVWGEGQGKPGGRREVRKGGRKGATKENDTGNTGRKEKRKGWARNGHTEKKGRQTGERGREKTARRDILIYMKAENRENKKTIRKEDRRESEEEKKDSKERYTDLCEGREKRKGKKKKTIRKEERTTRTGTEQENQRRIRERKKRKRQGKDT